ncbi:MAG TPA: DUF998 domain-containing protein [Opitutaceae bacterium]|nr:DUF998 domain-containing protein [Opitutaceae bacterium]
MRQFPAEPAVTGMPRWAVLGPLGIALTAMAALHVVQSELDPIAQPVSFYVWGRHGWLLPVALGAFGVALLALARARADARTSRPIRILALAGATLLLTAIIPADRWFPWERPPTISGLIHAAAAMLAPVLLVWPMMAWAPSRDTRLHAARPWLLGLFLGGLAGSAASLALGFSRDGPPPWIGLSERILAFAAAGWVCGVAWRVKKK